jgi:hypothetical protein
MGGGNRRDRPDRSDEYQDREPDDVSIEEYQDRLDSAGGDDEAADDQNEEGEQSDTAGGSAGGSESESAPNVTDAEADSPATGLSVADHNELQHQTFDDPLETNVPTPAEFATQTFTERAQARRIRAGHDGHQALPVDPDADRVGGWQAFDRDDVIAEQPLGAGGRTVDFMQTFTMADDAPVATNTAYVTQYGNDPADYEAQKVMIPTRENAHSQMAVFAAMDSMGVAAPRHTYDADANQVIVEGVAREGFDAERADQVSPDAANRVEAEQFKDVMAVNVLLGNIDLKSDNVMIGENGQVVPFDYDFTQTVNDPAIAHANGFSQIQETITSINAVRDVPLATDTDEVYDRVGELARELNDTGTVERVATAAAAYDEFFDAEQHPDLESIEKRVRQHVNIFTQF